QALSFTGTEGVPFVPSSTFTIRDAGGSPLNWSATVTTQNSVPWLSLDATGGTVPAAGGTQNVTVTINPNGLFAGTYTGSIVIQDATALQSPQALGVTLVIASAPPPSVQLSTNQLTFLAKQGQASPPDQTIQVTNSGGRVLSWFS